MDFTSPEISSLLNTGDLKTDLEVECDKLRVMFEVSYSEKDFA